MHLQQIDDAVAQHMQHGAMPVGDPLTESLYSALEAPAPENAQPRGPAPAPLSLEQQRGLADAAALGRGVQWLLLGTAVAPAAWHVVAVAWHWLRQQ
jgi:hypothetical protein